MTLEWGRATTRIPPLGQTRYLTGSWVIESGRFVASITYPLIDLVKSSATKREFQR